MKVLIVNKFYYNRGGDCVCAINLERMLRANGHDTAVYAMQYAENQESPYSRYFAPEVSFSGGLSEKLKAAKRIFGDSGVKRTFAALLEDFRPDVVHFNNTHSYLSPEIVKMAKEFGAKTVWTLHDYKLICPAYSCLNHSGICDKCIGGSKFNVVKNRCMKGSLSASVLGYFEALYWNREKLEQYTDAFISPSRFLANCMVRDGFDSRKLNVVCNFMAGSNADSIVAAKERQPYCTYVGRLSKEKGVETLLRAARILPFKLKIAGGGPLADEFRRNYACENIEFLGHMPYEKVKEIISLARFSVMPSECYENNPLSVIESLCYGTPVLGANIGGIPELVTHDKGCLFESGNVDSLVGAIEKMWNREFDYSEISRNSLPLYSERRYLNEILAIYNR